MPDNKKKVLFIEKNLRNEKLGIMYLAAALKAAGHHADLVQADKEDLEFRIRKYKPDYVAFSITTGDHIWALWTAKGIKEIFCIPNIFGGPHCTFFPEFGNDPTVDFIVTGQGEKAIVDIVEGHVKPGIVKGDIANNPDDLLYPDRDIFYQYKEFHDNPMKNIITSRACPYRCSYCFNHSYLVLSKKDGTTKRWFLRRSVNNVIAEINEIRDKYPLEKVLFIDDSFIQGNSWLNDFIDAYTRQVGLSWLCSVRVNRLDKILAERLFGSGLEMVNYALESADPDIQKHLLNRGHIRNKDIIRAIRLFNQFGIRARMQNMIGLPLNNPLEDALNTLQFNIHHKVTDSWCSIFQPYPRTALGKYCLDHGFINDDQLDACAESFFNESRLNIPNKMELYALQKLWYFIIEGGIPMDFVQILIKGNFTNNHGDRLQELRFRCSRQKLYGLSDEKLEEQSVKDTSLSDYPSEDLDTGKLIRIAFKDTGLPKAFIDIISEVSFPPAEKTNLMKYIQGKTVNDPPLYTIDDKTGDLKYPGISIWTRGGTSDDIKKIETQYFMYDFD